MKKKHLYSFSVSVSVLTSQMLVMRQSLHSCCILYSFYISFMECFTCDVMDACDEALTLELLYFVFSIFILYFIFWILYKECFTCDVTDACDEALTLELMYFVFCIFWHFVFCCILYTECFTCDVTDVCDEALTVELPCFVFLILYFVFCILDFIH